MKYLLKYVVYPLFVFALCFLSIWAFVEDRARNLFEKRYADKFR